MQNRQVVWSLEALNDFEDYIDWYLKNVNVVIASDFVETITVAISNIKANNYIGRMVDEIVELREYVVQKYPYLISYWIKHQFTIVITSFLHQKMKK